MPASQFAGLLNRFYDTVARVVDDNGGVVDKLIGDGVLALFIPRVLRSGSRPARRRGRTSAPRPHLGRFRPESLGAAGRRSHTGSAYVGVVGAGKILDFTALGDATNVAARLGSAASAGELMVSEAAAQASALETAGLERRRLQLKGRAESVDVVVLPGRPCD